MFLINQGELLSEVTEYLLHKKDIVVKICLHHIMAGKTTKGVFQAIPTGPDGIAPEGFCGFGNSSQEALKQCLERIKDVERETFLNWFVKPLYPDEE